MLVSADPAATRAAMTAFTGEPREHERWERFYAGLAGLAELVFPTMLEPLRSREAMRALVGDDRTWSALFEAPLSETLRDTFDPSNFFDRCRASVHR